MIFWAAWLTPVLAIWLWYPLRAWGRKLFVALLALTVVAGLLPVGLIWASWHNVVDYAWVTRAQVISGGLLARLLILVVWGLLRDVGWGVLRLLRWHAPAQLLRHPASTTGVAVLALATSAVGLQAGTTPPEVVEHEVTLQRLPAELDGLRVALLADLHATPINDAAYNRTVVERTNAAQPDLILLPGDLVDGDARTQAGNIAPLADLRATYGVWSAPGNHEYYSGYDAWAGVFERLQLNYLANEARVLDIRGHKVAISGVGDPVYGRLSEQNTDPTVAEGVPPDIEAVATQARAGGAQLHILLGHQPKMARSYAGHGVDLQVAGHTHGGHIVGMDRWLVAPANNGFVRGLYDVGDMRLFVSSGAGLWPGFAVRLGVPPAIEVLVLRAPRTSAQP